MILCFLLLTEGFHLILSLHCQSSDSLVLFQIRATPVPCTEYILVAVALCVIVRSLSLVCRCWCKCYIKYLVSSCCYVSGNVFGVNVNCPSDDIMSLSPYRCTWLFTVDWRVPFDPITTLAKVQTRCVIPNPGATPVPCTEYIVGEPCTMGDCKIAVFSPVDVGVNVTLNTWSSLLLLYPECIRCNVNCPLMMLCLLLQDQMFLVVTVDWRFHLILSLHCQSSDSLVLFQIPALLLFPELNISLVSQLH